MKKKLLKKSADMVLVAVAVLAVEAGDAAAIDDAALKVFSAFP